MHNTLVQYHLLLVESAGPGPNCKRHHVLTQDLHTRSAPSGKSTQVVPAACMVKPSKVDIGMVQTFWCVWHHAEVAKGRPQSNPSKAVSILPPFICMTYWLLIRPALSIDRYSEESTLCTLNIFLTTGFGNMSRMFPKQCCGDIGPLRRAMRAFRFTSQAAMHGGGQTSRCSHSCRTMDSKNPHPEYADVRPTVARKTRRR